MGENRDPEEKNRAKPVNKGGRPKGVPNKTTILAREAISRLVDGNTPRLQEWLDEIAQKEGPLVAWKCMMDVIEYHVPKLSRTEHTGPDGGPQQHSVTLEVKGV